MGRVKIDRFGRVLIPKKVRDQLGLTAGEELALEVKDERLVLEAQKVEARLVPKGKLLVFQGALSDPDVDWVARMREERLQQVAGYEQDDRSRISSIRTLS